MLFRSSVEYLVATRDGSMGTAGDVLDVAAPWVSWADSVCVAASVHTASDLSSRLRGVLPRKRTLVALAPFMACSVGACQGCSVPTARGMKRACSDGPVFDLAQVSFGEYAE